MNLYQDSQDKLPDDHPAVIISDAVEGIDLPSLNPKRGGSSYHPKMMVKTLIYAYTTGTFSSREIARLIWYDPSYLYLTGWQTPDFPIIKDFRNENLKEFKRISKQVVDICNNRGLDILEHVDIDNPEIEANASYSKIYNEKRIELKIRKLVDEARAADDKEDSRYGPECAGILIGPAPIDF